MKPKIPINNQPWLFGDYMERAYSHIKPKPQKPVVGVHEKILVDTKDLMRLLDCGKKTAITIGRQAHALVRIDRKLFWSVEAVRRYINNVAE